jgi:hypothetical protein
MSNCEAGFTKMSIDVEPLTESQKKNKGTVEMYNYFTKNDKLEMCVRKCANNSQPFTVLPLEYKYKKIKINEFNTEMQKIYNGMLCTAIPSSETKFIHNDTVHKNINIDSRRDSRAPSRASSGAPSESDTGAPSGTPSDEPLVSNTGEGYGSDVVTETKITENIKAETTYKCSFGKYDERHDLCMYKPAMYLLHGGIK